MIINEKWDVVLKDELKKDYFRKLGIFVKNEYKTKTIFPPYQNIFDALRFTDYDDVKVVILGVPMPPSLQNIFKELYNDLGIKRVDSDLTSWAKEGVLLLNSIMTVEKDKPLSHKDKGWEIFTDTIISKLNEREQPVIFVLWGSYARSKKELITNSRHKIIESVHPSPLSANRGFFGSKPFSKINKYLKELGKEEIKW